MSINSSSINEIVINGELIVAVSESISETIANTTSSTYTYSLNELLLQTITLSEGNSTIHKMVDYILENLNYSTSDSTRASFLEALSSFISILDSLGISYNNNISENLTINDNTSPLFNIILEIVESLNLESSEGNTVRLYSAILEAINILETTNWGLAAGVTDTLILTDTLSALYKLLESIISEVIIGDTLSSNYVVLVGLSESFDLNEAATTKATLKNAISESFIIKIPSVEGGDTYLAYLLSPETNLVSNYNNFNFKGCTKFNDKYLFINRTGLYEYGGTTDAGSSIRAEIETVAFSFDTSNLKQVPAIYLGVTSDNTFILKVRVDGKGECTYKLNKRTNNLQTQKVDIGKGLIGRYFQFEIITEATQFDLESIDFYPVALKRKL